MFHILTPCVLSTSTVSLRELLVQAKSSRAAAVGFGDRFLEVGPAEGQFAEHGCTERGTVCVSGFIIRIDVTQEGNRVGTN